MSGGSHNYIFCRIEEDLCGQMEDEELNELMEDVSKLAHDLEWYHSADIEKETFFKRVAEFKNKWLRTPSSDCISRKNAVRWVKTECNPYGNPTLEYESGKKVIEHLEKMPSAKPEIIRCERTFQEIIVEYPSISTYPEYEGKPYFSIKYTENGQGFIGYGTYKPEVLSEYLKEYFMPSADRKEKTEREAKLNWNRMVANSTNGYADQSGLASAT